MSGAMLDAGMNKIKHDPHPHGGYYSSSERDGC